MYINTGDPTLAHLILSGNYAYRAGGGIYCHRSSPTLTSAVLSGNSTVGFGGGFYASQGNPTLRNVVLSENSATSYGGGVYAASEIYLTNATFAGNYSSRGGGMYNVGNFGGPSLTNVIMWGNSADTAGDEIYNWRFTYPPLISYSLIEGCGGSGAGWSALLGTDAGNNIDADPLFVSPPGDLSLGTGSLAIDAGDNSAPNLPATDILGNPRVQNGTVDMGAYEDHVVLEHAAIDSIVDVPGDQGGWVRAYFTRSHYDSPFEANYPIYQYNIHRRVDDPALAASVFEEGKPLAESRHITLKDGTEIQISVSSSGVERRHLEYDGRYFLLPADDLLAAPPGIWEVAGAVLAQQQAQYIALVPTLGDSATVPWSVYYISAHSTTPAVFFDSPPDSGYSVDNIPPGVPQGLMVTYNTGSGNQLIWGSSPEPDFQYYNVYRGTSEGFSPGPGNLVHKTATEGWTDPDNDWGDVYYKITALDHAGNESDPASPDATTGTTGPSVPMAFALYQNVPNPFSPTTVILYDVPKGGGRVELRIYDVAGRLIRTLVDEVETPGSKRASWDGRDDHGYPVSTGVYFYRMTAPDFTKTRKMILLRQATNAGISP
jgi:predicted outer membrane repeat protein